jgi:hypothetical protein
LKGGLEAGFGELGDGGLEGREELVRKLLGSPALVQILVGREREVAIQAYTGALRGLFMVAVGLAGIMVMVQAGTGWRRPTKVVSPHVEDERVGGEDVGEEEEDDEVREREDV